MARKGGRVSTRRKTVELFEQMRREYEHGEGTITGVARTFGVHRRMVRQALAGAVPPARKRATRQRPTLGPIAAFIDEILEADRHAPRKQRHTAHRIWRRVCQEKPEWPVGESTIRRYVRQRKGALSLVTRDTFIPQSYTWGVEAQVDWYEAWAEVEGEREQVAIFCMRSMASGAAFHRAYRHATQQAFLEAHEEAFAYFGGVFHQLRYDNLKSAVQKILRGRQREETARFVAFRSHWGFESEFCNPARGHEKGGVEGEGGQFRRNYLVPLPVAPDLAQLNALLVAGCREDAQRVIAGRTHTVGAAMVLEREHLLPLAHEGFDLAAVSFPMVNSSGCVKVRTNWYSVPLPVGTRVEAKVQAAYVEVWYDGRRVAQHERCFGRQQPVLELEHYLDVLLKKPGAFAGSTPLHQWRAQGKWPESFDRFWETLRHRHGRQQGTRAMIEVLLLGRQHSYERLRAVVHEAVELGVSDVAAIRYLLDQAPQSVRPCPEAIEIGRLARYERPLPSMAAYDRLLGSLTTEVLQ